MNEYVKQLVVAAVDRDAKHYIRYLAWKENQKQQPQILKVEDSTIKW